MEGFLEAHGRFLSLHLKQLEILFWISSEIIIQRLTSEKPLSGLAIHAPGPRETGAQVERDPQSVFISCDDR